MPSAMRDVDKKSYRINRSPEGAYGKYAPLVQQKIMIRQADSIF
jgi:hypothetical protein